MIAGMVAAVCRHAATMDCDFFIEAKSYLNYAAAMTYSPAATRYDSPNFYRRCGRSGIKLPLISLGLWHNFGGKDSFDNARAIACRAFDLGITHFDLAN